MSLATVKVLALVGTLLFSLEGERCGCEGRGYLSGRSLHLPC